MSFNARIKSKRDTASNWETNNPVLLNGELIIVDTNAGDVRFKIGDGVKTYTQLPFQDESLYNVLSTKADSADLESIQASIVQSDLSQIDPTQIDYVKGVLRNEHLPDGYPHKEMTTILDGTFEFADTDGLYTHQITDENFTYTDGKSYAVIWDGATYRCVATNYSGLPILGNLAIAHAGSDTGEPFLFLISGTNKLIYTNGTAATHMVTVCKEIIHPIAEEFLPEIAIENGMVLKNLQAAMPSSEQWCSVTYGNGKFVAVANGSNGAAYSEDGVTWTITSMTKYGIWKSVTYGNGKFVTLNWNNSNEAFYSEDGVTWTAATLPSYAKWYSVTYGNGKFVAVAENSTNAVYSEDGITWTATTLHSSVTTWQSVTYGNGKFVAVAGGTTAAYSIDGITWTETTLPSSSSWQSVTYGNGKFVAVSDGSAIAYSYDGVTWTETALPNSVGCSSVTYGNDKFVAIVPYSISAFYSNDGITWTETSMPTSAYWASVTYGNGKFVAVVSGSTVTAYSKDGINWKTELKLISQNGIDVTDGSLIALNHTPDLSQTDPTQIDYVKGVIRKESLPEGYPYRETVGTILDGTFEFADSDGMYQHQIADENFAIVDGESYAVIWDGKTYRCVAAIFLGGVATILGNLAIANAGADTGEPFLFVQQGATKLISTSDTATTHTVTVCAEAIHQIADDFIPDIGRGMILKNFNGVMPSPMNWSSITYGNGKFVTVAVLYNQAAYCDDDLNWKSATLPSSAWWFSITYGNGKFVIVSYDNSTRAAYSEDGVTWTASTLPSSADWRSVTYGNGKFVAAADNSTTAAYSTDGITWTAATLPSSQRWCSVTYGNGKFVAVAQDSTTAAYSTDGITWTASTLPSSETWLSVTYGNGKFVAVANYSTTAAYSTDGITWTASTMPSRANWYSITYGNGKFVAVADNSTAAAYSEDGITWIQTTLPSSERWQSVTYGNGKFVAVVNASNTVAYSRDGINWNTELKLIIQNGIDVTDDTLIALEHTHEASKISAGTFAGQVVAKSSEQTPGTMLLRNSKLVSADETPTVNGEICWVYS